MFYLFDKKAFTIHEAALLFSCNEYLNFNGYYSQKRSKFIVNTKSNIALKCLISNNWHDYIMYAPDPAHEIEYNKKERNGIDHDKWVCYKNKRV